MKNRRNVFSLSLLLGSVLLLCQLLPAQTPVPQLGRNSVREVVVAMTVEEKVRLLVGMGFNFPGAQMSEEDKNSPERVPGAAGRTHPIARLGIPSLTLSDGPAGVRINPTRPGDSRTYYATGFPIATSLAATWDPELVRHVGEAFGNEVREFGVDILLAPAMNIHRNPLGGRNFEYYSEDPLLAGTTAAAMVNGIQSNGVGTSVKHFAGNNQEFNRMQSNTVVSERALREIYLRGFEIAVKQSHPWTIMSSYNLINGTYASQNRDLLTSLLRNEWGFSGFVMTDWFAGNDAAAQMNAGNDLLMPGIPGQATAIIAAVNNGTIPRDQLDDNVARVLNVILLSPAFKKYQYSGQPDLKAHAMVSRQAATEGMVLLKNSGSTLPLASAQKVALFGDSAYDLVAGGTGSGNVNRPYVVGLDQGLATAGFGIDNGLKTTYNKYIEETKKNLPKTQPFFPPAPVPEMPVTEDLARAQANSANVAVITIGRSSGEFTDRKVEDDFVLSASEQSLIRNVAGAFHDKGKKVVVVLNVGGPIEIASWRDQVDGILVAWQPGEEGGNAIADVLSGKVNPCGKLPTTFPAAYNDVPSSKTFPGKELVGAKPFSSGPFSGKPAEAVYDEGIYVGYRYYNTFGVKPAYEFGYGLSYTDFSYSGLKVTPAKAGNLATATVTVTNTGKVTGKTVAEVYISAPGARASKPESELKGYAKTGLLKPGESQNLSFIISPADLASFDTGNSAWVADSGTYAIRIGASSSDFKQTAKYDLPKTIIVEKTGKLLSPQVVINEIKPTGK